MRYSAMLKLMPVVATVQLRLRMYICNVVSAPHKAGAMRPYTRN